LGVEVTDDQGATIENEKEIQYSSEEEIEEEEEGKS
jgi:hypothetical protein